jgi:hypothetical protein
VDFMEEMDDEARRKRQAFVRDYMAARWIPFRRRLSEENAEHYTQARQVADAIQDSNLRGLGVDAWKAAEQAQQRAMRTQAGSKKAAKRLRVGR